MPLSLPSSIYLPIRSPLHDPTVPDLASGLQHPAVVNCSAVIGWLSLVSLVFSRWLDVFHPDDLVHLWLATHHLVGAHTLGVTAMPSFVISAFGVLLPPCPVISTFGLPLPLPSIMLPLQPALLLPLCFCWLYHFTPVVVLLPLSFSRVVVFFTPLVLELLPVRVNEVSLLDFGVKTTPLQRLFRMS